MTTSVKDIFLTLLAGAANGFILSMMYDGGVSFLGLVLGGILAYAVTNTILRVLNAGMKSTAFSWIDPSFSWIHLIVAGTLNGVVFAVLRPYLPFGTVYGILTGVISFYSGDIIQKGLALA